MLKMAATKPRPRIALDIANTAESDSPARRFPLKRCRSETSRCPRTNFRRAPRPPSPAFFGQRWYCCPSELRLTPQSLGKFEDPVGNNEAARQSGYRRWRESVQSSVQSRL